MKKTIIIVLLSIVVITANAQFLFRITGGGEERPSYILGTIHLLSGSLLDSIPTYLEAEAQCQQMFVEQIPTMELITKYEQAQRKLPFNLPKGKTIFDIIDKESADILKEIHHTRHH